MLLEDTWKFSQNYLVIFQKFYKSPELPVCLQIVVQMYLLEPIQRELSLIFFFTEMTNYDP